MKAALAAWNRFWFEPMSPLPIALFRVGVGILCLLNGLLWLPDYLVWMGHDGVIPAASVAMNEGIRLCPLVWFDPPNQVVVGFMAAYIIASFTLCVGLYTRFSTFAVWLLLTTFKFRSPTFFHHCDTMLRLYAFGLLFVRSGATLSLDAYLAGSNRSVRILPVGQRIVQIEIALIYFHACCSKLLGRRWRDGTAVYYATHLLDNVRHPVPAWLDHLWAYRAMTWGTLLIEFSLFTLIWLPRTRPWALLAGVALHLAIDYFMGLDLFEYAMVIGYLTFLQDGTLDRCPKRYSSRANEQARSLQPSRAGAPSSEPEEEPVR